LIPGCAVKRPPDTATTLKNALPATTAVPGEWTSKDVNAAPVVTDWIKSFGDPQLQAIVEEALKNNLYLQAAATRIDVAANMVTEAHSQMMPFIGAFGSATYLGRYEQKNSRGQNKGRYNASSLLGSVSWEVDLWGRIRSQTAAAQQELAATESDVQFARESLAAATANAWYFAVCARVLQDYAKKNVEIKKQNLELAEAKQQVGEAQEQQVAIAAADLQTAQAQLTGISSTYEQVVRASSYFWAGILRLSYWSRPQCRRRRARYLRGYRRNYWSGVPMLLRLSAISTPPFIWCSPPRLRGCRVSASRVLPAT